MNPILLAQLIQTLGSVGLPIITKLLADIEAGKTATTVTSADTAEVTRLNGLTAAAIFQKEGVALPSA